MKRCRVVLIFAQNFGKIDQFARVLYWVPERIYRNTYIFYLQYGGRKFLWNDSKFISDPMISCPKSRRTDLTGHLPVGKYQTVIVKHAPFIRFWLRYLTVILTHFPLVVFWWRCHRSLRILRWFILASISCFLCPLSQEKLVFAALSSQIDTVLIQEISSRQCFRIWFTFPCNYAYVSALILSWLRDQ